ncbi:MAG: glutamate-5-semialdehyde dehydrogenase [Clostridia bacterium]|nr:glutamate-5-semialdehyde dehydrogenase [Clostridia bacterium]
MSGCQTETLAIAAAAKQASFALAAAPEQVRSRALEAVADALESNRDAIFAANAKDMDAAKANGIPAPVLKRLKFDESKLADVCEGLRALAKMDDPIGCEQLRTELADGLVLSRVACPIGVVGVIFEARPDALVQIAGLCLRSGNAVLLKGGREALHSNAALYAVLREASEAAGVPQGWAGLLTTREEVGEMLRMDDYIDLIIPRGSNSFVRYIMDNSRIPVLGHSDGVCHVYIDACCDAQMAARVTVDAKTQYPAACNAAETLLVHKDAAATALPITAAALHTAGVKLVADARAQALIPGIPCRAATEEDWKAEYLDHVIAVRIVDSIDEAIAHINRYGSHHTDCIVTSDEQAAKRFFALVDSAGVYHNCSTRFADGFRYGFGAEVGISTGKIHARGPMGLEGLCSYKYLLSGHGDVVADFAGKKRAFTHRKLR